MGHLIHWLLHRHWTPEPDTASYFASVPDGDWWFPISRDDYYMLMRNGDDIALLKLDEVTR